MIGANGCSLDPAPHRGATRSPRRRLRAAPTRSYSLLLANGCSLDPAPHRGATRSPRRRLRAAPTRSYSLLLANGCSLDPAPHRGATRSPRRRLRAAPTRSYSLLLANGCSLDPAPHRGATRSPRRRLRSAPACSYSLPSTMGARSTVCGFLIQALDAVGPVLPVLVDRDEQLQVGAGRQLLPGPRTGLLQHGAALSDHHALLALALHQDLDADPGPLPLRHPGGDRIRQLVVGHGQQLLAHQLGHPRGL